MAPLWMVGSYLKSQYFITLPKPTKRFTGKTIIVTGANSGLGLEAARQIVSLGASRVILAVRSLDKGRKAEESIRNSTGVAVCRIEVWQLDMCSYNSVKAFAEKAMTLDRLDVVVENAGINRSKFSLAEDNEMIIAVNFVNTMLLGLLILPKLRETSVKLGTEVVLTFVGTHMHWLAQFEERKADSILAACADEKTTNMKDRYSTSRVMLLMAVRELADLLSKSGKPGLITTSVISPGSVATLVARGSNSRSEEIWHWAFDHLIGRRVEEGARTLVWAAYGGRETAGKYLEDCKVAEHKVSTFVRSDEGKEVQKRVWKELLVKLEIVSSGITENI